MRTNIHKKSFAALVGLMCVFFCFTACKDEVDQSDMYTFQGQLMTDFLENDSLTTSFSYLTRRVRLSSQSASTVYDLLSARGNYTCFAPTNEAVQAYLDSVFQTTGYDITQTPDSIAEYIVNNCLLDHSNSDALLSTSFQEGTIEQQSFAGRFVTINFDTIAGSQAAVYVDKFSRIIASDQEVENGVVHIVDKVVAPTTSTLSALIESTENLQVFANLLNLTGYAQTLDAAFRDMDYEQNHPESGPNISTESSRGATIPCPIHRDRGFTAFVETDSLFAAKWGLNIEKDQDGRITNWDEVLSVIEDKCKDYYPQATSTDYTSDENAVHQFVGYHLTNRSIPYNNLVIHYNEIGYGYRYPENLAIDVHTYYPTLTQNRLLKVTEGKQTNGKRINRYVSERNLSNYEEVRVPRPGLLISNTGENAALNGYFYTIDNILVYDDDVPNKVLNERLRFDICDLLPAQMSSGFRRVTAGTYINGINIPRGYFDEMTYTEESNVVYLPGYTRGWANYQGDEYNIVGQYDVTIQLPHVPYAGTYEFRIGLHNQVERGMMQVYFGTNKDNLEAIGLPLDMRMFNATVTGYDVDTDDQDEMTEIKKRMRINGYLKAPRAYGRDNATMVSTSCRDDYNGSVLRRVLYTGNLDPKQTYYARFKSVLENTNAQFFFDYIELVPKSVYNGDTEEDDW